MRAQRIMAGFRRIGIVLAVIVSLPLFFAVWSWAVLGHAPPRYAYFLLALGGALALVASASEWIAAGFSGEDEPSPVEAGVAPSHPDEAQDESSETLL